MPEEGLTADNPADALSTGIIAGKGAHGRDDPGRGRGRHGMVASGLQGGERFAWCAPLIIH
jgi:hypothetical protein